MKKGLVWLLALLLVAAVAAPGFFSSPAEAKGKKAKVSSRKKTKKKVKKKAVAANRLLTQSYYLEEGVDETDAANMVEDLKELGAKEASINVASNTLSVTFAPKSLSAVTIISKLKSLGYTVKQIN